MTSANDPGSDDASSGNEDGNTKGTRQQNGPEQQNDPGQQNAQPQPQSGNPLQQQNDALLQQGQALQEQVTALQHQLSAYQQQGNAAKGNAPGQVGGQQQWQNQSSSSAPSAPSAPGSQQQNQASATTNANSAPGSQKRDAAPAQAGGQKQPGNASSDSPGKSSDFQKKNIDSKSDPKAKKSEDGKKGDKKDDDEPKKSFRKPIIIALVLLVLVGLIIFQFIRNKPEGKAGYLRINGRIEGYEVNVGAKIAGRVESISNREGDEVKYLQPLVKLSDDDIRAQLRGAKARYQEALSSVAEAEALLNVSREQVSQAKLNVSQSREDARGRIEQAEANVATTKAQLSQAMAQEVQAKADLTLAGVRQKRYDELVVRGAVTQDEDDQAHSTYESTLATVDARKAAVVAAQKQVYAADAGLVQAKSNSLNPPIRLSQQASSSRTVTQNEAALMRARHDVNNAKSSIDEISANIAYLNINSPIHGVVTARTVEPGAVVAAGQTVISLINLDTVYLRAYVPDSEIGKVRLHQKTLIYYDSNPKHGISGKVIEIDPEASFTPENIYFRDDRVKQVFGIKILIDNPSNYAKPGMPADADIDITTDSGEKNS